MGKFAQGRKPVQVAAVAEAVTLKIAGRYESVRYRSEQARTTLLIGYRNMSGHDRKIADRIAKDILDWMRGRENTIDLRCDVDVHIYGDESLYAAYRTGIVDYGLYIQSDGNWSFGRIQSV